MAYWQDSTSHEPGSRVTRLVLGFLAALHMLAALSLIFILAGLKPAAAAEDLACGGHNLMAEMQKSEPETYSKILSEGAALPNGEAIFWKVEKPGIEPSYLLGTMHLSDPRVLKMPNGAPEAFAAAKTLIVESDEIVDQKQALSKLMLHPELMMFTDNKSIIDYLTPEQKATLEADLKERGMPLFAVQKMKPWMISSAIALPSCEIARKNRGEPFLDQKLAQDALAQGKTLKGLETIEEQLNAMASVSMEFHIKGLLQTLNNADRTRDVMETLINLYVDGNPSLIGPFSKYAFPPEPGDTFNMGEFEEKLITNRNHNMADRAAETLAKGQAFMAVGAMHLPGPEGLVALLRQQGFTVTPVAK